MSKKNTKDVLTREEFDAVNCLAPIPIEVSPGDHQPLIVYEQAVRAIRACCTIDETKYWNDKADALAAWARIYKDDSVMREARALKLHAYRRIGELADILQVVTSKEKGRRNISGFQPGARSLLLEHGLKESQARDMLKVGRVEQPVFDEAINREEPPSPTQLCGYELTPNPAWSTFANRMSIFLSATKKISPEDLAATLDEKQVLAARRMIITAQKWLNLFDEELRK